MSNLCLQEQQRTPELIPKFLDFLDVFLVNLVRDIGTVGDLVDIVRNVIGDTVYLFQLIFVDQNDVSLKDHSSHKFAEIAHTAVLKLHLDGSHFFGADTDFQVHCSLLFIFYFLFFLSSVFQVRGRRGSALCQAMYHVGSLSAHPHDTVLAGRAYAPSELVSFRAFRLGLFSLF